VAHFLDNILQATAFTRIIIHHSVHVLALTFLGRLRRDICCLGLNVVILSVALKLHFWLFCIFVSGWWVGGGGIQEKMMTDAVILSPNPNLMVLQ